MISLGRLFMVGGPSQVDTYDFKPELQRLGGQPVPDSFRQALDKSLALVPGSPMASVPRTRTCLATWYCLMQGRLVVLETIQVDAVFQLALLRKPTADESAIVEEFLKTHSLPELCRAAMNTNEFAFLD